MTPSRCVYCGAETATPGQLTWMVPDDESGEQHAVQLALCVACSQAWCPQSLSPAQSPSPKQAS